MTRFSVIVPGYNTRKEWWVRCIASIDKALTEEDEIIVVDDGSDVPVQRDWFAAKLVTVIRHDKNSGLPTARNSGLDAAKGRFVTFVDSDDEVRAETYSRCIDALEAHGADVAAYGVRGVYVNDGFVVHDVPEDKNYGELTPSDVGYLVKRRLFYYSCNKVFRKSFLDEHDFKFDPTGVPCEDAIFNVRLVREKAKWVTVAYEGYIYYRYDGSLLSTYKPTYVEGTRACTKAWHDYKAATPGAYEALDKYGLGWYDETSDEDIVRGQWTNIWRRKSPYSLAQKWRYAKEHAAVLGRCTLFVFVKKAIVMWLRAHCYWKMIRVWHEKKFLKKIGAKVEPIKRFVAIMNIPSPYRLHLLTALWRALDKRGVDFHVHFMAKGHADRPKSWLNPKIDFPHTYWTDYGFGDHHFNPGMLMHLLKHKPDIMMCGASFDTFTGLLAMICLPAKMKCIWLEGNTKHPGKMTGLLGYVKRLVLSKCRYAAVPGKETQDYIALHQKRTKRRMPTCIVLPNLVDEKKFKPRSAWPCNEILNVRERLGVGNEDKLCLVPARFDPVKGLVEFVEVLDNVNLSGWKIAILGHGPLRTRVETLINGKGLSSHFKIVESVPYDEVPIYYAASDLMLLPSIQDMNPLAVVEALHSGLPIAESDQAGNVHEAITDGRNGWVLPVLNKGRYSAVLAQVFETSLCRLREMGRCSLMDNAKFWNTDMAITRFVNELFNGE